MKYSEYGILAFSITITPAKDCGIHNDGSSVCACNAWFVVSVQVYLNIWSIYSRILYSCIPVPSNCNVCDLRSFNDVCFKFLYDSMGTCSYHDGNLGPSTN